MATKKKALPRTLKWERKIDTYANPTARFGFVGPYLDYKRLSGQVGVEFLALGFTGAVRFLDKRPVKPRWGQRILTALATHTGITVTLDNGRGSVATEHVKMCSSFRNAIMGRIGNVRYATVKAT
jgi:hypothetical protein